MRTALPLVLLRSFVVVSLGCAVSAQILQTDSDSVTTYRPTATTSVQGVRPLYLQRAVNVDGSGRASGSIPAAIAGNPSESAWGGTTSINSVMLATGAYSPTDVDISLPTKGFSWLIGRTYNAVQQTSSPAAMDSAGYQGANWFQSSQPEIVFYDDADNSKDTVYLVLGADRYAEFKRADSSSTQFSGRNGATGCFKFTSGGASVPDTYVLTDTRGSEFTFFGFDVDAGVAAGQLWKIVDADSNTAYVGDSSTMGTAISSGYDGAGRIVKAYDASDRRFTYTYTTIDSVDRLTRVKVETKSSGSWSSPSGLATVGQVDYAYYTVAGAEAWGDPGDLKQVTIAKYLSDGTTTQTLKKYYRYWEGTYNSSTNPGYPHALQYVYDFEGIRRFDYSDSTFDEDFLSATENSLKPYAAAYFEYDSSHRVRKAWFNGSCGCGGGANGTTEFSYATSLGSPASGYEEEPRIQVVVKRPDSSYLTQYFDETGQPLSQVISDGDPSATLPQPPMWITLVERNSAGCVTLVATPENATGYTHSTGAITSSNSAGLRSIFTREGSGDTTGFMTERRHAIGVLGTTYLDETLAYDASTISKTITDVVVRRAVVTSRKSYAAETTTDTGSDEVTYSYTAWSGAALSPEKVEVTAPTVSSGKNGSNLSLTSASHLRKDGLVDFEKRPTVLSDGSTASYLIAYKEFDKGQVSRQIVDANTSSGDVTAYVPSGFASDGSATKAAKKTDTSFTSTNLRDEVTPAGANQKVEKQYITRLKDERLVVLTYPASGSGAVYGPVSYQVLNHAGKTEVSGVISLPGNPGGGIDVNTSQAALSAHIDETDDDPITAIDTGSTFGSLAQMHTSLYDESGHELLEERSYFLLPGSGAGSAGTNYDATKYAYDDLGRRIRVKEASGTIRRTTYDLFGRSVDQYIGTNDYGSAGGESSGPANMVKTEHLVYDGGSAGLNGRLTSRTSYVEDSTTDQRITTYLYDDRGRRIVDLPPSAPFTLTKYDNENRVVAVGQYSSSSGLDATDDPTGLATNRMTLNETLYDEAGRVWKTIRHKIDDADGSKDDTLETKTWYDELGRVVKVDGAQLTKTRYDRMGRVTDEFILATDDDSTYDDVKTVSGDIVLEQRQTRYDPTLDTVIFTATISRKNTDYGGGETTGELDTNGDNEVRKLTASDIKGRLQVTGYWYDRLKREYAHVDFGTNGGSTLDFTTGMSTPPSRSDTELGTSTDYNLDGTVDNHGDPKALVTKYVYDAMGRLTKEIKNYNAGVNSGAPYGTDDNVTVVYTYVNGLRTALTADLPSGLTDQVTTYTYGTVKGASAGDSKIATGHLLQKIAYPDSSSGSDVVSFAYNAQGQEIWKKDQEAAVIETDLDTRGRTTQKRVTTLSSFDGAVRRIATTYDVLGRTQLVTQYDNATVGSGSVVDEVKYTYDDWGNIENFEQDRDSAVGAGGSVNDYEISYLWEKATGGRNTIRKYRDTLPSGMTVAYNYLSSGGLHDDQASRLTAISDVSRVILSSYSYTGVGQLVGTQYPEPQLMWDQFSGSGTSATYPDLDQFNRVVKSRWTRDAGTPTDFYDVELAYDRNSNIVTAEDQVHAGFDVKYTMDDIDRLTEAKEGTLVTGSISSPTRDQQWTLSQTGNWDVNKVDLNGDLDFADAGEENDTRAHNTVNEISTRLSGTKTLVYDAAGNLTDDAVDYKYEWDAFYRLRKVKKTSNSALVAEYRYNGLGYRIAEHIDTDLDNDVDGSDLWYYDAFDEHWRQVARFRSSDTSPKEEFVAHNAGLDGRGGSSYIDALALRLKDADTAWTSASDTVLEERVYYCQNWRADVSALVSSDGRLLEWAKYSAYGVPFGLPAGDTDSDGDCDTADDTAAKSYSTPYDVRYDLDLDGDIDGDDYLLIQTGVTSGHATISGPTVASHRGFEGRSYSPQRHLEVRARSFDAGLGRWLSRDSKEYTDGVALCEGLHSNPVTSQDPTGNEACSGGLCGLFRDQDRGTDPDVTPLDPLRFIAIPIVDCCGLFKVRYPDEPGKPPKLGGAFCCFGMPVSCIFSSKIKEQYKKLNGKEDMTPEGYSAVAGCIRKHEDTHLRQLHLCLGDAPKGDPHKDGECEAYAAEIQCYNSKLETTPNGPVRNALLTMKGDACNAASGPSNNCPHNSDCDKDPEPKKKK